MLTQFDPDKGPLFKGEFTSITVKDPAIPGHTPNLVLDPGKPFDITIDWKLQGTDVPLYLAGANATWSIEAFAESVGPGPEVRLAIGSLAKGPAVTPANRRGRPMTSRSSGVSHPMRTIRDNSALDPISAAISASAAVAR